MADQSLIPVDQEYGNRQKTVEAMQAAGISRSAQSSGQMAATAPAGTSSPSGAAAPTDFLTARKPSYPQNYQTTDPLARLRNLAQTSPNVYVRALLKEILA